MIIRLKDIYLFLFLVGSWGSENLVWRIISILVISIRILMVVKSMGSVLNFLFFISGN